MYVDQRSRLIYLGNPRTASMATAKGLGWVLIGHPHGGLDLTRVSPRDRPSWTVMTTVRNPWDTVISWSFWTRTPLASSSTPQDVEKVLTKVGKWIGPRRLFLLTDDADVIWRYEALQDDINRTLGQVGHDPIVLPSHNVSITRGPRSYRDFYNPDTRQFVHERFRDEIERFGYVFEGAV